ncbi:LysR family transcriptional regulator [Undibacterium sp. Jales W-56]|uniref:LysR family transcriptional regulator n=1 Tax=Undibacterium sp. Jales W-56 TaxID=2897325 RepID=UPI0021D2E8CA|nr:LysR family transcriptional regulator [Undibacterium sp. Jales W-56]MCU6432771.1 LysR family transcriptional regulator [Undibacterium sp. Jales W-56]
MLKISLDALQIMDAIDRRGSFAAAGKEMFRVPSTISYTVAKLEEELGVQMFKRLGPKVTLTLAGKELLKEGRYLLKAAGDLERRVQRVATGWETELTIGMDSLFSPIVLKDDILAFCGVANQTRLRIVQEALSGTWEALLDGRVDILLGAAGEGPSGGGYSAKAIGKIPFVFAVSPDHPFAERTSILTKSDFQQYRAVTVADSAHLLPARTVGLLFGQDAITVPTMRAKLDFQLAGIGFGFLPEFCAREAIQAGRLIVKQVEEPKAEETIYLAWRSGEPGAALNWWIKRAEQDGWFEQLCRHLPSA